MLKEEKVIVTEEETLEKIENNLQMIETAYGTVKFNEVFFKACGSICLIEAIVGGVVLALNVNPVAPIIAMVAGGAGALISAVKTQEIEEEKSQLAQENVNNLRVKEKILKKLEKNNEMR